MCESVTVQAGGRDDDCDGADTTVCAIQDDKLVRRVSCTCRLGYRPLGRGWHGYIIR